ncbi:hypothetical protein CVT26_007631 [Gymnopilus dilepis]|uniref:Uncharacterized protein n=1 Tax=Gymnopilus dilepis TaxID=231916 RepID=A0A409VZP4_9AGAR|nr:hypothetical protein CVT26_007631 [Gymnopilus dilepis]
MKFPYSTAYRRHPRFFQRDWYSSATLNDAVSDKYIHHVFSSVLAIPQSEYATASMPSEYITTAVTKRVTLEIFRRNGGRYVVQSTFGQEGRDWCMLLRLGRPSLALSKPPLALSALDAEAKADPSFKLRPTSTALESPKEGSNVTISFSASRLQGRKP